MELETLKVCIDGVDCSGKTTLWNELHRHSGYRWKNEDRSFVTMVVYARLHGRAKADDYERQLIHDLGNLNNKYVLINPSWKTVEERFLRRGDDLHDHGTMRKIHALYSDLIEKVSAFPNVLVLTGEEDSKEAASQVHEWILSQDSVGIDGLVDLVRRHAAASGGETSPMRFSFLESGDFPQHEPGILDPEWVKVRFPSVKPATVEEFNRMVDVFSDTIDKELRGENMYGRKETDRSRRFIFTQDACVSFIQAMVRGGMMKFYVAFRSSHAVDVFPADVRLMYHMAKVARDKLTAVGLDPSARVLFDFTLNSAHTVA
jgi:hypothetical protein